MKRLITTAAVILLLSVTPVTADEGDGGYAGAFLQVPIGARPTAMSGAYRALSDDGAGPLYNPAGVGNLSEKLFATSYRTMKFGRTLGYLTLLFPARHEAVIGISWLYAGSGSVAGRNTDGDRTGTDISFNNHDIGLVFAKRFENVLSGGVKLKYLHATLDELTSFSVSFDFGMMLYLSQLVDREERDLMPIQDVQIGLTVRNIGSRYRWDTGNLSGSLGIIQDDRIPVEIGLGVSARFFNRKLILASDLSKNAKQAFVYHGGTEYLIDSDLAVRGGYSQGRFTVGGGYIFKLKDRALAIDYAFSTDRIDEGTEHIFSFDLLF